MQHQIRLDEKVSVKSANSAKFDVSTVSIDCRVAESIPAEETAAPQSILIQDLCHAIQDPLPAQSLGYLVDECKNRHEFVPINPPPNPQEETVVTLDQILKEDFMKIHRFPPEKRANVATILASSLLQLQRTHWLKDNWTKRDIFFVTRDEKPVFDQPYLSQDFVSAMSIPGTPPTPLGSQFRLETSLECLGILLIELCFGSPIESYQHKVQLRPYIPSSLPNHEFNLAIARAWTWEEIRAENPLFPDPIHSCLRFPNLQGRLWGGKVDEVVHDMYDLIAKPLYDEMMERWPPRVLLSVGDGY